MEHYSAIKKNEILPFVTIRMNRDSIMPSEINQRKTNTVLLDSYVEYKKKKSKPTNTDIKIRLVVNRRELGWV